MSTLQQGPNVIVCLADDMGFSDLGCYGGEIPTPRIDALGHAGVRMSDFTVTPRCSPSRAALLTGRYPHETGIGVLTTDDRPHGYPGSLDPGIPTLAEHLRKIGYRTAVTGKWHLASDTENDNHSWPQHRGFDESYVIMAGAGSYFQPRNLRCNGHRCNEDSGDPDFYFTDAVARWGADFVRRTSEAGEPFFLYLAPTTPHWPLQAPQQRLIPHRGAYDAGWDELRKRRVEGLVREGIIGPDVTVSPRDPREPAWADAANRQWEARRMEVYAAQVAALDDLVGDVVDAIPSQQALDNTLILMLSDNGACAEPLPVQAVESFKSQQVCPPMTRDGSPVRLGNSATIMPGPEDTYSSYGRAWANLSNTPFRLYKRWVHEGGVASPCIVHWPAGRLAQSQVVHEPANLIDVVPTVLDAAGATTPAECRGVSLLDAWRGLHLDRKDSVLAWEHVGNCAIRDGRFKLVREASGPWELYDLETDRTELDNLAEGHQERVDTMARAWQQWADQHGVINWDDVLADYAARGLPSSAARG